MRNILDILRSTVVIIKLKSHLPILVPGRGSKICVMSVTNDPSLTIFIFVCYKAQYMRCIIILQCVCVCVCVSADMR
jgi:hypothetical protein